MLVNVLNKQKAMFYMKHGVEPVKCKIVPFKGKENIAFCFDTEETDELFEEWKKINNK